MLPSDSCTRLSLLFEQKNPSLFHYLQCDLLRGRLWNGVKSLSLTRPITGGGDILYCSCQEGKLNIFIFCKNNKLQNRSHFGNTSPFEFFYKFTFSSTNLSPITNSESKRYHYPVCHTPVATYHPLSRFQSSARGPALSPSRSFHGLHVVDRASLVENQECLCSA